jgi:hypothetical protein
LTRRQPSAETNFHQDVPLHDVHALDGRFRFADGKDAGDIFGGLHGPEGLEFVLIEEERCLVEVGVDMSDVVTEPSLQSPQERSEWRSDPLVKTTNHGFEVVVEDTPNRCKCGGD